MSPSADRSRPATALTAGRTSAFVLASADASFTTSALAPGIHTITAQYNGSQAFLPSSAKLTQKVQYKTSTTVTGSNPNPSRYGQGVTYTASVSA